jgi:hypothetical protein
MEYHKVDNVIYLRNNNSNLEDTTDRAISEKKIEVTLTKKVLTSLAHFSLTGYYISASIINYFIECKKNDKL